LKFQQKYPIRIYDCSPNGKQSFSSILNYMQDVASLHTVKLNITVPELLKLGYTWMLSRYHVIIDRYPVYMDSINISTWIADHKGLFSIRDYSMENKDSDILARMTSSWVLYDIKNKKIAVVDEVLPMKNILNERAIQDSFPTLPLLEREDHKVQFAVRKHDLDINRHVNNRVTAEWALEAIPFEITKTHELKEFEITFKGQAFYGDTISSICQISGNEEQYTALHHIINNETGQSIARVRSKWKKGSAGIF